MVKNIYEIISYKSELLLIKSSNWQWKYGWDKKRCEMIKNNIYIFIKGNAPRLNIDPRRILRDLSTQYSLYGRLSDKQSLFEGSRYHESLEDVFGYAVSP
jgi:hypothetical protein